MKKYLLIFIFASFIFSGVALAETSTTGFIPGQIWYSKEPLTEGETVDIHTIVWNGDSNSLSATIEFYDKNVILGSRSVSIPSKTSKDVSISWKVTAGDHIISASITSSKIIIGTTSKSVVLENRTTEEDKQFVSKIIKNTDGTPATSGAVIESKINEVTSKITDAVPNSVSGPVSETFSSIDDFRSKTYEDIKSNKIETQKKIDTLNTPKKETQTGVDGTEKPIAYVKLFFLSALAFIFGSKIIFYIVGALLVFIVARFIYRKIKNR